MNHVACVVALRFGGREHERFRETELEAVTAGLTVLFNDLRRTFRHGYFLVAVASEKGNTAPGDLVWNCMRRDHVPHGSACGFAGRPVRALASCEGHSVKVAGIHNSFTPFLQNEGDIMARKNQNNPKIMSVFGIVPARKAVKAAPAPGQPAFPGLMYNGGPVVTSPVVYTSFWGSLWSDSAHQAAAQRLSLYFQDLVASNFMNVLSQYGVGTGAGSGRFAQSSFVANVANQLTDADIQSTIQQAINAGQIPEPPANNTSQVLVIFLDENTEVNDANLGIVMCEPQGDTAFGYHNNFTTAVGNPFYYGVIPGLDDACLKNSCGNNPCSLDPSLSQEQRRTQVASHEFAEMLTDPVPPSGWYDQKDPNSGEVGDICNGESDTIAGTSGNTWTVQRIYSAYDDQQTSGGTYCLSQAGSPEPLLPGAP